MLAELRKVLHEIVKAIGNSSYRADNDDAVTHAHTSVRAADHHRAPHRIKRCAEYRHDLEPEALYVSVYSLFQTVFLGYPLVFLKGRTQIAQHIAVHSAASHLLGVLAQIKGALDVLRTSVDLLFLALKIVACDILKPAENSKHERKQPKEYQHGIDDKKQKRVREKRDKSRDQIVKRVHYLEHSVIRLVHRLDVLIVKHGILVAGKLNPCRL